MISKLFSQESKSIVGAAVVIGASSVLSRLLGLVRDRLLVSRVGVGDELDAYYASFQIPNFLFALLILGTLSAAFIPVFSSYIARKREAEAWRTAEATLSIVAIVMGAACLVLIVAAPWLTRLVAPGFEGDKLALTTRLTRVMMISPFLFALSAVFSGVLSSFRRFLAVSIAPLLYNASLIFGILFLTGPFGIAGVAYAAIGGALLHMLVQLAAATALGMKLRPSWDTRDTGVREIGRLFLPRVFGVDISQISLLTGSVIGSTIGTGAVSLFNLAGNIAAVPVGVVAIPFGIAAFPELSEAAAKGERATFIRVFATTFRQILFFLIPLTVLAILLRVHIVRVLIGSRNLAWDDVRLAAAMVGLFAVTLAFQGLTPLLARAFYALKNTVVPVLISSVSVAVNVALTYAALGWFKGGGPLVPTAWLWLGLFGIDDMRALALPLAFSAAAIVQAVLLFAALRARHGRLGGAGILKAAGTFAIGALATYWAAVATLQRMNPHLDELTFRGALAQAALVSLAGLTAYVLVLRILKSEELASVIEALERRWLRIARPLPVDEMQEL